MRSNCNFQKTGTVSLLIGETCKMPFAVVCSLFLFSVSMLIERARTEFAINVVRAALMERVDKKTDFGLVSGAPVF